MLQTPNIIVDARGLFCPMPIIKTSEAICSLDGGAVVEVITDDPAIEFDMPAWCQSHGHTIESVSIEGKVWRYFVRKGTDQALD
ncbi:MAG: sulfurtransferase TusA family protein [Candidatus Krumholzibacteria bacterium]|nr:sulfurtransferase TusA family protein [Candidatus Krumholzibacteria bacterium]